MGAITRGRLQPDEKLCALLDLIRPPTPSPTNLVPTPFSTNPALERDGGTGGTDSSPPTPLALAARRVLSCDACGHFARPCRSSELRTLPSGGALCVGCVPKLLIDETHRELRRLVPDAALRRVTLGLRWSLKTNVCAKEASALVAAAVEALEKAADEGDFSMAWWMQSARGPSKAPAETAAVVATPNARDKEREPQRGQEKDSEDSLQFTSVAEAQKIEVSLTAALSRAQNEVDRAATAPRKVIEERV